MSALRDVAGELERIAPLRLAAEWDAVGLLVGSSGRPISRVMTCLTLTHAVAAEAVRERVDLIVTHHPLPFRPVPRITAESLTGDLLLQLVRADVAVWSSHTAWDSAAGGINDQLAAVVGLEQVAPIEPHADVPRAGFGRTGLAGAGMSVADLARVAAAGLGASGVQIAGDPGRPAGRVGIVCGSGGDAVAAVRARGCDTLLTGEIRLHQATEAVASGLAVVTVGHHASERFSMDVLATRIAEAVPGLTCWASRDERDPLPWFSG